MRFNGREINKEMNSLFQRNAAVESIFKRENQVSSTRMGGKILQRFLRKLSENFLKLRTKQIMEAAHRMS